MAKVVRCRDLGMEGCECDFVARGETEEDVLKLGGEHAAAVHGMTEVPPEVIQMVRSLIRDE